MTNKKALLSCCIYIEALNITEEEKAQNEAKFAVWYENFRKQHEEYFNGPKR